MPGLSQLKQFNTDIQSLGDEITIRASRGEKPIKVPIPKSVKDINDSEDFVLGMPNKPVVVESTFDDDDLSDITGLVNNKNNKKEEKDSETVVPSFEAPDMSSLLSPMDLSSDGDEGQMPDFSSFIDETPLEEPEKEEVPEEISVADMGLDALLAGAGFDGTEGTEDFIENNDDEESSDFYEENDEKDSLEEVQDVQIEENLINDKEEDIPGAPLDLDLFIPPETENPNQIDSTQSDNSNIFVEPESSNLDFDNNTDFEINNNSSFDEEDLPEVELEELSDDLELDQQPLSEEDEKIISSSEFGFDFSPEISDFDLPTMNDDISEQSSNFFDLSSGDSEFNQEESITEDNFEQLNDDVFSSTSIDDDFGLPVEEVDFSNEKNIPDSSFPESSENEEFSQNITADIFNADDVEFNDVDELSDKNFEEDLLNGSLSDLDDIFNSNESSLNDLDFENPFESETNSDFNQLDNEDIFGKSSSSEAAFDDSINMFDEESGVKPDFSTDVPDYELAYVVDDESTDDTNENSEEFEVFDISDMGDIDFGNQETESQFASDSSASEEDFEIENTDFEIPGFSDVTTAKDIVKSKHALDTPDFSDAISGNSLPPNTLSDEQYKQFLKNLSEYPLNVRLAFEDFIIQDEFTEDAEFEIVEKILNKAPARQVASALEKMLDTSIPVPRDFEHRTAEEYAAYKKSLQYQLRNKIIPGFLLLVVCMFAFWGLFNFGKHCIYIPAKATSLYKEGYALLEADEYPQSMLKFEEASNYKKKKNWFFKFARGYRNHKQYYRAADIYTRILRSFDHDKEAGLEYVQMEMSDLANYEKAETILRREVLDYHINDKDGILLLADNYLEWGTEKDPSKLENAKEEYMHLIQLYGNNDLYSSRLMRYYIRTDNLKQVLNHQKYFETRKDSSLCGEDWIELSGYLLDKLYGPMTPSEEPLRYQIEGVGPLLQKSVKISPDNPIGFYNLGKYYIYTKDSAFIESTLKTAIDRFNKADQLKNRDIYKFVDTYRLLGENYVSTNNYLQAQEAYTNGITLFTIENENAGLEGNENIGLLYADLADINYMINNDYESAELNYKKSISLGNDTPSIRYRVGYINYMDKDYEEALGSFIKAGDGQPVQRNLLLAKANTFSLRNADYAAEGCYEQLLRIMDDEIIEKGGVFPQTNSEDFDLVSKYLYASNNYGVTLYKLAKRTGDSAKNAQSIVEFQHSIRAWDSLTRDQKTLKRMEGSNLAQENLKYVTHTVTPFEPAIYVTIPKTLTDFEDL